MGEKLTDDKYSSSGEQLRNIVVVFVIVGVGGRLSFLTDLDDGSRFDLISDLLHLREKLCPLGRVDTELSCRERQDTIVDFREFLDLFLDLCGTVRAVDVFHHIDCADSLWILRADLDDGSRFDLIGDRLHFREKFGALGRVDTELPCRKRHNTVIDFREFLDLFLDLCGAVCAVDVFHHVDDALGFRSGGVVMFLVTFVMLAVLMSTVIVIIVIIAAVVLAIVVMVVSAAAVFMFRVLVMMLVVLMSAAIVIIVIIAAVVLIVVMVVSAAAVFMLMVLAVMRVMMLAVFVSTAVVLIVVMVVSAAAFFSFMLIRFLLGSF